MANTIKRIIILISVALLMSCSSVPLITKLKLRNLDPVYSDPANLRLAMVVDKLLTFENISVTLTLGFDSGSEATSLLSTFQAKIDSHTLEDIHSLPKKSNAAITLFYLDSQNAEAMRLAQGKIIAWKQSGIEGQGMLSVATRFGYIGAKLPESLKANIYIQLDRLDDFLLIQRDVDLLSPFKEKGLLDAMQNCE